MRILTIFLTLLLLLLSMTACQNDEVEFEDILTMRIEIEIPAGLNALETHYFEYLDEATRVDAVLQANNLLKEDVNFIRPRSASLRSVSAPQNFDFVDLSFIEIGALNENFVEAYFIDRVPNNEDELLDLIPNEVNLKSRLIQDFVDIRLAMRLKRPSPATFRAIMELSFFIQR